MALSGRSVSGAGGNDRCGNPRYGKIYASWRKPHAFDEIPWQIQFNRRFKITIANWRDINEARATNKGIYVSAHGVVLGYERRYRRITPYPESVHLLGQISISVDLRCAHCHQLLLTSIVLGITALITIADG
jgi:hypothetical protein